MFAISLADYLYQHEQLYVDEIDRLERQPSQVSIFPAEAWQTGGWLFMAAEPASGDWNLARLVGDPAGAAKHIGLLPDVETSLLVPAEHASLFDGSLTRQPDMLTFISSNSFHSSDSNLFKLPDGFTLAIKMPGQPGSECLQGTTGAVSSTVFLLNEGKVQGYVKIIRQSRNFAEVYIELKPTCRGRGLAPVLLRKASEEIHQRGYRLIYVVASDNAPSLATARRAGLQHSFSLARFLRP